MTASFDQVFAFSGEEEKHEHNVQMLAFSFLSIVDEEMERRGITKKELARLINTSAAFITQLFRGHRKPNWQILAKIGDALDIDFLVTTQQHIDEKVICAISQAHKVWVSTGCYSMDRGRKLIGNFEVVLSKDLEALAS